MNEQMLNELIEVAEDHVFYAKTYAPKCTPNLLFYFVEVRNPVEQAFIHGVSSGYLLEVPEIKLNKPILHQLLDYESTRVTQKN